MNDELERLKEKLPEPPWETHQDFEELPAERQKELALAYFKDFASVVMRSIIEDVTRAAVLKAIEGMCLCGGPIGHVEGGINCRKATGGSA